MSNKLKIEYPIGKFAMIEGTLQISEEAIIFKLAMTESVSGPAKGVLKRSIDFSQIEQVVSKRRLFGRSSIQFFAEDIDTFESIPGAEGFRLTVYPKAKRQETESFVKNLLFSLVENESVRIDSHYSKINDCRE